MLLWLTQFRFDCLRSRIFLQCCFKSLLYYRQGTSLTWKILRGKQKPRDFSDVSGMKIGNLSYGTAHLKRQIDKSYRVVENYNNAKIQSILILLLLMETWKD